MHRSCYKSINQFLGHLLAIISITLYPCSSFDDQLYGACSQPFECGNSSVLQELNYPFWGINREENCGKPGFEIKCINNYPIITISTHELRVISADPQHNTITVTSSALSDTLCPTPFSSINSASIYYLNSTTFALDTKIRFMTILYGCPLNLESQLSWSGQYTCNVNGTNIDVHYVTHTMDVALASACVGAVVLPIPNENAEALDDNTITLPDALQRGFELSMDSDYSNCDICVGSGGQCGFDSIQKHFICYCLHGSTHSNLCQQPQRGLRHVKMIVLTVVIGVAMLGSLALISYYVLSRRNSVPQNGSVETFLKNYESLIPRRYTYSKIAKMTKSFKEKLGEGGYGEVFKGNLQDGCVVAVKVWKQSKGDGEDFVNEVMSICRTCHINVVPLLGFCIEGQKRALIYEFMPNGSLEKYIYFKANEHPLPFDKLFEIGVGIARGLEYLHRDCNTRIVHFDIKPHNILLDADFTPKISDFGLAKPFKQKDSIISMSGARGTAGYIAPEVFFRSYGGVSHKSDVYSFGMMVLEMVGCTKRENNNVEKKSEMYFPGWIYKQLEEGTTLDGERILNEDEKEMERKMILVGLWCIQANPLTRPPMSKVVEMLEGKIELLEVPPVPSLSSHPRRQQQPTNDDSSALILSSTTPSTITHSDSMRNC